MTENQMIEFLEQMMQLLRCCIKALKQTPEVHTKWIKEQTVTDEGVIKTAKCMNCREEYSLDALHFNYCPNCGAKMDGGYGID